MNIAPRNNSANTQARINADFKTVCEAASARLAQNLPVRRNLPGEGRLRFDRQLPFLCIYRAPPSNADLGTRELVTTEAAYMFASGEPCFHQGLRDLCQQLSAVMQGHFGTFLFIEIWAQPVEESHQTPSFTAPTFEICGPDLEAVPTTVKALIQALSAITLHGQLATVTTRDCAVVSPPGLQPLIHSEPTEGASGCCVLGLAIKPVYRDAQRGTTFPMVLQSLRRQLADALRQTIAAFAGIKRGHDKVHFQSFGPSTLVKAARIVDQQLCEVAESFDFLLQVTPHNTTEAWEAFSQSEFRAEPTLRYRPLPYHPSLLKRRLFEIEIERIEDPTLTQLFGEKLAELDRQLTTLRDLETTYFRLDSQQLFGSVDAVLLDLAQNILATYPKPAAHVEAAQSTSKEFVARARDEIDYYRQRLTAFTATVEVCDDIASGVMVSHDRLLVAKSFQTPAHRVEALLHHEIGTHLLTYFNGRCQPFRQLYAGLAGYEELQEGLAVLAECLCGGLTPNRWRTLAGRVVAVDAMTSGATFVETFSRLRDQYAFAPYSAFVTTVRAYRGGGLTKDIIYLRGLRDLLAYLEAGHDIEPLYIGKIGLHHLPYVQELRRRGIIDAPSILPRLWRDRKLRARLESYRGQSVLQLLESSL